MPRHTGKRAAETKETDSASRGRVVRGQPNARGRRGSVALPVPNRGVFGVAGDHYAVPAMGVLLAPEDDVESDEPVEPLNMSSASFSNDKGTRFYFSENKDQITTVFGTKQSSDAKLLMKGILTIEHRLVEVVKTHTASQSNPRASVTSASSPFKGAVRVNFTSVALAVGWEWKGAQKTNKCTFLVPYHKKLEKSYYQNAPVVTGDAGGTASVFDDDPNVWKEFMTKKLSKFEQEAETNSELVKRVFARVGIQDDCCAQEEEVYVFNSAVAIVFSRQSNAFIRVTPAEAGFFGMPLGGPKKLPMVTMQLSIPSFDFMPYILASIGELHFVTLACLMGQAVLACKPRFLTEKLGKHHCTVIMTGKANTGKTALTQIAVTLVGTDKPSGGRAFSANSLSEFEYGKRTLLTSTPLTISDPPVKDSRQYAEMMLNVFEGTVRATSASTYTPGAGPTLCVNEDFLALLRKADGWNMRLRTRVIVLQLNECVPFPENENEVYKKAQYLSYHLPELLFIDTAKTVSTIAHYETTTTRAFERTSLNDTALTRMASNLAVLYALGEHVSGILCPSFMFREVVTRHQDIVSVPSAVKYQTASKPKVAKETEIMAPFDDVSGFIAALIEYALVNADVKWYNWVQWKLSTEGKDAIAVRSSAFRNFDDFPFGRLHAAMAQSMSNNSDLGIPSKKVGFRVPKYVDATGQRKERAMIFFFENVDDTFRRQLTAMDVIGWDSDYGVGWVAVAQHVFSKIAEFNDYAEQDFPPLEIKRIAADAVRSAVDDEALTLPGGQSLVVASRLPVTGRNAPPKISSGQRGSGTRNDSPTPKLGQKGLNVWFEMSGSAEIASKLSSIGYGSCTDSTILAVAEDFWESRSVDQRKIMLRLALRVDEEEFEDLEDSELLRVPDNEVTTTDGVLMSAVHPESTGQVHHKRTLRNTSCHGFEEESPSAETAAVSASTSVDCPAVFGSGCEAPFVTNKAQKRKTGVTVRSVKRPKTTTKLWYCANCSSVVSGGHKMLFCVVCDAADAKWICRECVQEGKANLPNREAILRDEEWWKRRGKASKKVAGNINSDLAVACTACIRKISDQAGSN